MLGTLYVLFILTAIQFGYAGSGNSTMRNQQVSKTPEQKIRPKLFALLYAKDGRVEDLVCHAKDFKKFLKKNKNYPVIIYNDPELLVRLSVNAPLLEVLADALPKKIDRNRLYPYEVFAFLFSKLTFRNKNDLIRKIIYRKNWEGFEDELLDEKIPSLIISMLSSNKIETWAEIFSKGYTKNSKLLHWALHLNLAVNLYINNTIFTSFDNPCTNFKDFYRITKDVPTLLHILEKNPQMKIDLCELINVIINYCSSLNFEELETKEKIISSLKNIEENSVLFSELLSACKKDDVETARKLIELLEFGKGIPIEVNIQCSVYETCFDNYSDSTLAQLIRLGYVNFYRKNNKQESELELALQDLKENNILELYEKKDRHKYDDLVSNLTYSGMIKSAKALLQNIPNHKFEIYFGVSKKDILKKNSLPSDIVTNLEKNLDNSLLLQIYKNLSSSEDQCAIKKIASYFPGFLHNDGSYVRLFSGYDSGKNVLSLNAPIIESLIIYGDSKSPCKHRNEIIKTTLNKINSSNNLAWSQYYLLSALHAAHQQPSLETFKTLKDVGFDISLDKQYANREKNSIERILDLLDPQSHDFNMMSDANFDMNIKYVN